MTENKGITPQSPQALILPDHAQCAQCATSTWDPTLWRNRLLCLDCALHELSTEILWRDLKNHERLLRAARAVVA
jgi:hypothetical protein